MGQRRVSVYVHVHSSSVLCCLVPCSVLTIDRDIINRVILTPESKSIATDDIGSSSPPTYNTSNNLDRFPNTKTNATTDHSSKGEQEAASCTTNVGDGSKVANGSACDHFDSSPSPMKAKLMRSLLKLREVAGTGTMTYFRLLKTSTSACTPRSYPSPPRTSAAQITFLLS